MSYCIYLRKSRADKELEQFGETETLSRHKQILLDMAKKKNLNIIKIYEEVVSGETISARPEMQKLLNDISNNLYDGVLVVEVERLARGNTIDQGIVAETFKLSNTKIITPYKTYDPNNEFDEEYFEFGLFMARREYKIINRRIQAGRIASVKEGKFIGSTAPFGYIKVKINNEKGYTLKIDKEQAEIVNLIYNLFIKGNSLNNIAKKLDNLYKPLNSKYWSVRTIKDILTNPTYTGKIRWGHKKEIKKINGNVLKKIRSLNNDYYLVNGMHPAIISEKDFDEVQDIFKNRYTPPVASNKELKNPFTNLVFCKKCNSKLTRASSNTKDNYYILKCPDRNCNTVPIPIYLFEQHLLPILESWTKNESVIFNSLNEKNNETSELSTIDSSLKAVQKDILLLEKQKDKLYNLLEQDIYSVDTFTKRMEKLSNELNTLKKLKMKIIENKNKIESIGNTKKEFIPKVKNVLNMYSELEDIQLKNQLLSEIIYRIEYSRDTRTKKNQRNSAKFNIVVYPIFLK